MSLISIEEVRSYYNEELPAPDKQAANNQSLCSALIENNALQLVAQQNSEWRLHAPKQVSLK